MLGVAGVQKFVRETSLLPFGEMKQGILDRVADWREGPPDRRCFARPRRSAVSVAKPRVSWCRAILFDDHGRISFCRREAGTRPGCEQIDFLLHIAHADSRRFRRRLA